MRPWFNDTFGSAPRLQSCFPPLFLLALAPAVAAQENPGAKYARAEQFLSWRAEQLVTGNPGAPQFFDGDSFWYRTRASSGHVFVAVDPNAPRRSLAFDHDRLAAALSLARDTSYEGGRLPFESFDFVEGRTAIQFSLGDTLEWRCDIRSYQCEGPRPPRSPAPDERSSPDGRWIAFARDENLWVRSAETGEEFAMTRDGEEDYGYAAIPEGCCQEITSRRSEARRPPVLQWSPDSRRIATHRYDERGVGRFHLLEAADGRPVLHSWAYPLPGDSIIPTSELWIFDLDTRAGVRAEVDPQPGYFTRGDTTFADVQWSADGEAVFYTTRSRDFRSYVLHRVDATTGAASEVLTETGPTYVELNQFTRYPPAWRVLEDGEEIVWWSERDGFGHLYLYGAGGAMKRKLTQGPWIVTQLLAVDLERGTVLFAAAGREEGRHPYYEHLYSVSLDGGPPTLLSPQDAHHALVAAPSGRYFVDRYSTPTDAPATVLRDASGRELLTLEEADISGLEQAGWTPPLPFRAKGRDGVTEVRGLLWFPSDFDPRKRYPVVDYIYPGPQVGAVTDYGFSASGRGQTRALAELGFIVFAVDAFGTPIRSKAFHDAYYGNMGDNGLPDHISALRELAARHPQMDLERVGIYGHSGGGFSSTDAILRYPDFFHVAVSGAGNHDNRGYMFAWAEKYQGLLEHGPDGADNYNNQANQLLAANLKGKLLLHYGTLDDNVHPNMTIRLIDELVRHNKDFDMFIMPNRNHGYASEPYVLRRTWDYFVRHLLGVEPPQGYRIAGPSGFSPG